MQALIVRSHFHLIVFCVALFVCFAPEWFGAFFQKVEKGAVKRDRGSHAWLIVATGTGVFAAFFLVNANFRGTALISHQPCSSGSGLP